MKLRGLPLALIAVGLLAAFTSIPARADTVEINLGSATGGFTFTGISSGTQIDLTIGTISTTGTGQNALLGTNGSIQIGSNTDLLTLLSSSSTTSDWSVAGTESFCFTSSSACGGTNFLTGTLSLIDVFQTNSTATTDTTLSANLTGLSGTDAALFGSAGIVSLSLDLSASTNLDTLLNNTNSLGASLSSGEVLTAEPSALAQMGIGLLALVAFGLMAARRRREFIAA